MDKFRCLGALAMAMAVLGCESPRPTPPPAEPTRFTPPGAPPVADAALAAAQRMVTEGRETFRFDTFGDEAFWGGTLQLHQALQGEKHGGVGTGVTPKAALGVGLKVDMDALPKALFEQIKAGKVDLDSVDTTLALLKINAVVGVKGVFDADGKRLASVGVTCALCHSTVDDAFAPGIGHRLDGWPNRDLDVGAIAAMSPDVSAVAKILGVNDATVRKVFKSWGPGKYDAILLMDGKAFRPDGKTAATVLPAAFGLAGVNLHTYAGWGSVTYWNAYVATTQMHGKGTFIDSRLADKKKFPIAAKHGFGQVRTAEDRVTPKLAALHFYQLALEPPRPPAASFDAARARRGEAVFTGAAQCASCHVPPLFTEPGWGMHTAKELGIDDFHARRSPDGRYRTTPLRGLFTRLKGGFYHDGRFPTLAAVVDHYDRHRRLALTADQKGDLIEFLKSL